MDCRNTDCPVPDSYRYGIKQNEKLKGLNSEELSVKSEEVIKI
jgi:hypothetical protein